MKNRMVDRILEAINREIELYVFIQGDKFSTTVAFYNKLDYQEKCIVDIEKALRKHSEAVGVILIDFEPLDEEEASISLKKIEKDKRYSRPTFIRITEELPEKLKEKLEECSFFDLESLGNLGFILVCPRRV